LFWTLFNGIGALCGALMMWIAPSSFGMTPLLASIQQNLPLIGRFFTSFALPGVCLLVIIGVPHLVSAVLVMRHHRHAPTAVIISGVILILWILLQLLAVFGPNPTSFAWLVFGVVETALAIWWILGRRR